MREKGEPEDDVDQVLFYGRFIVVSCCSLLNVGEYVKLFSRGLCDGAHCSQKLQRLELPGHRPHHSKRTYNWANVCWCGKSFSVACVKEYAAFKDTCS